MVVNFYDFMILNHHINEDKKFIGEGKTGKAYLLDNGNVLKITTDVDEFETAKKIIYESPKWSPNIFKAEKINGKYHIEKEYVEPIFPKAGKNDSMNYGDARFEFTGRQYFRNEKDFYKMEKVADILGLEAKEKNGMITVIQAIAPFQMCQPNNFGESFIVQKFDAKSISKILYKDKKERELFEWFVYNFFLVKSFGGFTGDLYQNIGVRSNGDFCFFDVM
jgi:hypothetical protein